MGYPSALTAKTWGFYDGILIMAAPEVSSALTAAHVIENDAIKICLPWASTARAERGRGRPCARMPLCAPSWRIKHIAIWTRTLCACDTQQDRALKKTSRNEIIGCNISGDRPAIWQLEASDTGRRGRRSAHRRAAGKTRLHEHAPYTAGFYDPRNVPTPMQSALLTRTARNPLGLSGLSGGPSARRQGGPAASDAQIRNQCCARVSR